MCYNEPAKVIRREVVMRLRTASLVFAFLFMSAIFLFAQGSAAIPRFALVIGNSSYTGMPRLRNPVNDATDLAACLKVLGFNVTLLTNANRKAINQAIVAFREALAADRQSEGVFFFAGHGVQTKGVNYLMPVGADIHAEVDLDDEAVSAQKVLGSLEEARNRVNLVILDACRDNPLPSTLRSSTRGLAVVTTAPPETLILYSTAAGHTASDGEGRNSPFAQALLAHIADTGDVTQTVKVITGEVKKATGGQQTPYVYMGLSVDFVLNARTESAKADTRAAASGKKPTITLEKAYGSVTVDVRTKGMLYLNGESMAEISPGSTARLDNLEIGQTTLEMRYENGHTESKQIEVSKDSLTTAGFTYIEHKVQSQVTAAPPQRTSQGETPAGVISLPLASIKLDRNFDDWRDVEPALFGRLDDKGNLAIDKVHLAVDAKNLYVRFEIKDDTPSSFFHPNNFNTSHLGVYYGVSISRGSRILVAEVTYERNSSRWWTTSGPRDTGQATNFNKSQNFAMKGSSVEAAFPLKPIIEYLGLPATGAFYAILGYIGYRDTDWSAQNPGYVPVAQTEQRLFTLQP